MHLPNWLTRISPLANTLGDYQRADFVGDLIAGAVVAIMLIPQGMAYAMLAGLPPEVGLYASIVPLLIYSLLGSSNALSVGPVAMVSLLVVTGVGKIAEPGSSAFLAACLTLALMVGVIQIALAILRLGFLVNFISHPVLKGFTSAAALVIGFSQLKHLFGTHVASSEYPIVLMGESIAKIAQANWITFAVGISSCLLLLFFCKSLAGILKRMGLNAKLSDTLAKIGPLVAVVIAALLVWTGGLSDKHAVAIVGHVPSGLPQFTLPASDVKTIIALLPLALIIAFVGYLESISVATALADRQQKKIDSNRELLALGMADLGAAFTGGYPVTGGFSRSIVNYSAGARTPIGSVITALLIALSVTLFTPLFYYIPNSVLAAIILVAVAQLVDIRTPFLLWRFSRNDAIAFLITFVAVLLIGIEKGILVGMGATIFALLWRTSHPHIAEVGRVGETEHFRNIQRHEVQTTAGVLALRIDESLHFANVRWLEAYVLKRVERSSDIHTVLLIASGINDIDSSGIEFLESLDHQLAEKEVKLIMSEVKGPVTDRLKLAGFDVDFLERRIFLSTDKAMQSLVSECNQNTKDAGDFGHFGPQFATTESIPQSK